MMRNGVATTELKKIINSELLIDSKFIRIAMTAIFNEADPDVKNDKGDTLFHILANELITKKTSNNMIYSALKTLVSVCNIYLPNAKGVSGFQLLMNNSSSTE